MIKKLIPPKRLGFTLVEIMIAVAVFIIILSVIVVNYNSSNKITDLKFTTEKIANEIRALQANTLANIKEAENVSVACPYEFGYLYKFNIHELNPPPPPSVIDKYEVLGNYDSIEKSLDLSLTPLGQIQMYDLGQIALESQYTIYKIEVHDRGTGNYVTYNTEGDDYSILFLFPEARIYLINDAITFEQINNQTYDFIKIFIHRQDVDGSQGVLILDRQSGTVNTEIINQPV